MTAIFCREKCIIGYDSTTIFFTRVKTRPSYFKHATTLFQKIALFQSNDFLYFEGNANPPVHLLLLTGDLVCIDLMVSHEQNHIIYEILIHSHTQDSETKRAFSVVFLRANDLANERKHPT